MQQHTELEDRNTNDLRNCRVGHGAMLVLMHLRLALLEVGRNLFIVIILYSVVRVPPVTDTRLRSVCGVCTVREAVAMGVMLDADFRENGSTPSESDELDDEDHEDAAEADRHGVGLWALVSAGESMDRRRQRYSRNLAIRAPSKGS